MDLANNLSIGRQFIASRLLGKRIPLAVTYYVTYRCNYRCRYCHLWKTQAAEMNTEQAKQMIKEFDQMGAVKMGFTGGEPLLRKDIGDLISYAHERNMLTTLCSNGELVEDRLHDLSDLDVIQISFDGPREIHERYRRNSNYENVVSGIRRAHEAGISVVASTVLTKDNIDQVDWILDFGRRQDII